MRGIVAALALGVLAAAAAAQPSQAEFARGQSDALQQSMAAGQAAAQRPGDEALTCDQMQSELAAAMQSQNVQSNVAENGALAKAQMDRANQARAGMGAQMAGGMIGGVLSSFIPGAGYAQQAMMAAQMRQMQAQASQANQQTAQMNGNMMEMMPEMMRGQRLMELGQAKNCPFAQGYEPMQAPR